MKNNAKLSLLALSLALGTSMAYASDDIPVVPASVMKKDVPAPVTSGQSSHEVVGSMNENPLRPVSVVASYRSRGKSSPRA